MLNLKKVIALVCVLALTLTTVAFGATYGDVAEDSAYYEAVETLNKLGIVTGYEDGTYKPEEGVTRAEMAALINRIQGYGDTASGSANTSFTDVPSSHWASGYIANASGMGIINGYGDGTFGPEDSVLYEQAVKMIMAALGYTPYAEQNGGYPTGYLAAAQRYDVSLSVANAAVGSAANRGTVAQLLANAIDTPLMVQSKWNTNGEVEYVIADGKDYDYKTLMSENLGIVKLRGVVVENSITNIAATKDIDTTEDAEITIDVMDNFDTNNKDFQFTGSGSSVTYSGEDTFLVGETDAEDYLGQSVIVYVRKVNDEYEIISIAVDTNRNNVSVIGLDQYVGYDSTAKTIKYYKDGASTTSKLNVGENGLDVVYNYVGGSDQDDLDTLIGVSISSGGSCLYGGTLTLIDNDDKTGYDVAIIELAQTAVVDEVDDNYVNFKNEAAGMTEVEIDEDAEDEIVIFLKDGEEIAYTELQEWDVLSVIANGASADVIVCEVVSNEVVGTIASKVSSTTSYGSYSYRIDGTTYDVAENAYDASGLAVGDGGTFYIDKYGKIAAFNEDSALATGTSANYAYIYGVAIEEPDFGTTGATVKLQMVTADGVAIYEVNNNATVKYTDTNTYKANVNDWTYDESTSTLTGDTNNVYAKIQALVGEVVKYTKNASGYINGLTAAAYDDKFEVGNITTATASQAYDEENGKIGSTYVDEDALVFVIDASSASDSYLGSIADLEDENEYTINKTYATNRAEDYDVIVIDASGITSAGKTSSLAVIVEAGEATNDDGEDVWELTYYIDGEKVTAKTDADVAAGTLPTIGDVVKVKVGSAGVITDITSVVDFADGVRDITTAGVNATVASVTGNEAWAGGRVEAYKQSSAQATIGGNTYKLSQAANTYIIDVNARGNVTVSKSGSYKYWAKIYDNASYTGTLDLYKNDVKVKDGASLAEAQEYADYVYVRTYEGKVKDVVVVRGIDKIQNH